MSRKKAKPTVLKSKGNPLIEMEIAVHHHQQRELERQSPTPRARPRGRREYMPAPMPTNAEIDAVLAQIRRPK